MADIDTVEATRELLNFLSSQKGKQAPSTNLQSNAETIARVPSPETLPPNPPGNNFMDQFAILTKQALGTTGSVLNAPPKSATLEGNLSWFDRNQRTDERGLVIPIDTESGLNLGDFSRVVWQRRPEDRVAVLKKMFPNNLVRQADTGEPIVEVAGPGGTKKDVLLNPVGLNAEDFVEAIQGSAGPTALGTAGLLAGEALGARVGGAPGAAIGKIAGAAIGTGLGGALTDVSARAAEGLPLDVNEIARQQAKNAAVNALFDVGAWTAGKLPRIASPFATSRGPLQFNLQEGKQFFKDAYGIDFKTTAAEESGAPILQRLERTESQLPGSATVLGKIYAKGQEQIAKIYDAAIGKRVPEDVLGTDLIAQLRRNVVQPAEESVQQARDALVKKGETELVNTIDSIAPTAATRAEAGETARASFKAARDTAKGKVDAAYAAVRAIPGGTGKILPGDTVADMADQIAAEFPKVTKTQNVTSPITGPRGQPIVTPVTTEETLKSGIPEGIPKFISDMQAQRGQLMSIDELTRLKNAARDEIAKTEAVPGVKDRWFGMVSQAYDKAIDDGLNAMPGGALKTALEDARTIYKTELLPFDREGLHDILRTPYESGFQSPEQLVNRLFSGVRAEHNYKMLQEALGPKSPAFDKIRRSILDSWTLDATNPLTQRINPSKLEESLLSMRSSHPTIYNDVVGPNEQKLFSVTASLRAAGKEIRDVDPDELKALLQRGNVTRAEVQSLMDAQAARDQTLANEYIKNLATGKPTAKVSPSQFVDSLFNSKIDNTHLTQVLSNIDPSSLEHLQTAALYRIATKASESNVDMAKFLAGQQSPVQAFALAKALGPVGSLERQRNEILLGPDYENLVRNTIAVLAPREIKTGMFKAAGSMAATGMLEKLLSVPLQYLGSWAKKSILALGYTNEGVKRLLINQKFGPMETAAYANTLIASEPFVRALNETFGKDAAFSIVRDAKQSIDRFVQQDAALTQAQSQQAELLKFLQTQKGKVKTGTTP